MRNLLDKPKRAQSPVLQEYRLYSGVCADCAKPHPAALLLSDVPTGEIGLPTLGKRYHLNEVKIRNLLAEMAD